MGKAKKLNDTTVAAYKANPKKRLEIPDGGCPGLYLQIMPSGTKSWAVRYRSPTERGNDGQRAARKLTLGLQAGMSLKAARAAATAAQDEVARGNDPATDKRDAVAAAKADAIQARANTVDAAIVLFLRTYKGKGGKGIRESTRGHTAALFGLRWDKNTGEWKATGRGVLAAWKGWPIASVSKKDARALIDDIAVEHGVLANRTLTALKTFFGWAMKHDLLTISPVAAIDRPATETERERVLTPDEIKALWKAADAEGYPFGDFAKLLLLTGVRRDEAREAAWSEFDLAAGTWLIPAKRSKNHREHLVPLSPAALALLHPMPRIAPGRLLFTTTGDTPIDSLSKAITRLRGDAEHWTWHDLRRTFYSGLQSLKFPIEVAEACVNHKGGTLRGVARVYGRYDYLPEKTAAFEAWARHLDGIVNGRAAAGKNVIPMVRV